MFPLFMSATFSCLQTGYKHAVHKAARMAVPSDQNAALSPDLWFHICLFTDGFTILTTRQFSRRPTSSSLMQDLNHHCKAPVISSSTLYTVTVQYKIAACFTPFFKIFAPLRWDFSSYFETAGGF